MGEAASADVACRTACVPGMKAVVVQSCVIDSRAMRVQRMVMLLV